MAKWDVVLAGFKGQKHYRYLVVGEGEKYALSTRLLGDESDKSDSIRMILDGILWEDDVYLGESVYTCYASDVVGNIGYIIEEDKKLEEAVMWLAFLRPAIIGCLSYTLLEERLEKYRYEAAVIKAKECLSVCKKSLNLWSF